MTDPANEHFAGKYAGQLDTYADALESAGEKVIRHYIYYPISGMLVEVGRSNEAKESKKNATDKDDGNLNVFTTE